MIMNRYGVYKISLKILRHTFYDQYTYFKGVVLSENMQMNNNDGKNYYYVH